MNWRRYILPSIILGSIAAPFLAYIHWSGYTDPVAFCRIGIHYNSSSLDKDRTVRVIEAIKAGDPQGYRALCRNIDDIYIRYCAAGDWHLTDYSQWEDESGCYIAGSHVLYLTFRHAGSRSIGQYAADVAALGRIADDFWGRR